MQFLFCQRCYFVPIPVICFRVKNFVRFPGKKGKWLTKKREHYIVVPTGTTIVINTSTEQLVLLELFFGKAGMLLLEESRFSDNMERLTCFGLTRQEAKIYLLLLTEGSVSGYEAAKRAGISRSNAYGALAGLVDKGAAYILEEQSVRYAAVPVKEFCGNKIHFLTETAEMLEEQIPKELHREEHYITICGRRNVEDKIRNMLEETRERVYFFSEAAVLQSFEEELRRLIRKGCKVVLLTEESWELPGATVYHTAKRGGSVRLITDSSYALTGELREETHTTCLYSANRNLVQLLKDALANEIQLNVMKQQ